MARTYVVTGAGSGIGKVTADLLREQGHEVVGVDLRGAEIEADLSTPEGRGAGAEAALERAGGSVDAVIACAGISAPIAKTVAVNFFGVTEFLEALQPALAASSAGRAVVVSSMASLQHQDQVLLDALLAGDEAAALARGEELAASERTGFFNYSTSKRAIARWVRRESITDRWAGAGIPLNAVGPGVVITPMTADLLATPEGRAQVDASVPMPLGGHQPPESIASLLMWLASAENSHCAGQTIYCDGGSDVVLRGEDAWSWGDASVSSYFARLAEQR